MGTYLGEQSRMSLSANPWRKVPVYSYMAGVLAGAELGLASIKALAGLAYPWQCGGRGGVEIAGLARSGCCAMGERRTRTGGGSRVATPYWPAAQRGDQQAADDACVVLGRCVSDCASKQGPPSWRDCGTGGVAVRDPLPFTRLCSAGHSPVNGARRLPSQEFGRHASLRLLRGDAAARHRSGGVSVWWNATMRSDTSANSSSLLGLLRGDAIRGHGLD